LRSRQVLGVAALRGLLDPAARGDGVAPAMSAEERLPEGLLPWTDLIEGLLADGHGLVMTMGKGGVGKTTVAARIALALAQRGAQVHLTTTDPAAHAAGALDERPPGLTVGAIDPGAEVAAYRTEVLATTGAQLDAHGLALLNEDLSSPCTEEIAVFQAFAREVERARGRIVVMDTAPTGHTVLLLDAAQSYHREVQRQAKEVSNAVRGLLPRLRDPCFTRMLLCTLAEATPVHEAAALQAELRRAGMEPYAWVVNQSLLPLNTSDALLQGRRAQEQRYVQEVLRDHAARCCLLPWQAELAAGRVAQAQFQAS
jgi:arsenite-transporting ATPase